MELLTKSKVPLESTASPCVCKDTIIGSKSENTSSNIRSFVSMLREGYSTVVGNWKNWKDSIQKIINNSANMNVLIALSAGSLMRSAFPKMSPALINIRGNSTSGKSIALQTIVSLRADPKDLVWCFDSMSTLKWYVIAAENNFLCLDDIHMSILPDNSSLCKPVSSSFFSEFESKMSNSTLITTSLVPIDNLAGFTFKNGVEINLNYEPLWPISDNNVWLVDYVPIKYLNM
jgi:hypothetical protein